MRQANQNRAWFDSISAPFRASAGSGVHAGKGGTGRYPVKSQIESVARFANRNIGLWRYGFLAFPTLISRINRTVMIMPLVAPINRIF
jgi:hypothetical protein